MNITTAFTTFSDRATRRSAAAFEKIRRAEYGPKEWLSDVFGFWIDDVFGAACADTPSDIVFLTVGTDETSKSSRPLVVAEPAAAAITDLVMVGNEQRRIPSAGTHPHVVVDATTVPGAVVIVLQDLGKLKLRLDEQYLGWLYEDEHLLATVAVVVR